MSRPEPPTAHDPFDCILGRHLPAPEPLPSTDGEDDDPRIAEALEAYLSECKGRPKPRKEEFLRRYPDIASELRVSLDALDFIQSTAQHLTIPVESEMLPEKTNIGDYRIIREVGRGGMGIVYEAEQISLGRKVALKVLPFAAALDPRHRQRFQVEAQAAAHLQHKHIVPIHAVGCEKGVHFYAMQFIDGQSLATVIRDLRKLRSDPDDAAFGVLDDPSADGPTSVPAESLSLVLGATQDDPPADGPAAAPELPSTDSHLSIGAVTGGPSHWGASFIRAVAKLGVQAAEALDHAHSLGVIHRDIKPANLMVDRRGQLFITDFGLARFEDDLGLTRTGDLLGTLRYMSPEQAAARHILVDQRTDIYSLGVTIYELLTLRPLFETRDRQELLNRIANDEPTPPRKINPTIPPDLETILLKAMAKDPASRYPTAQALADDFQRFLDDKPILARRPGTIERGRRWVRRHRTAVLTAGMILVFMASLGTMALWMGKREADEARRGQREVLMQTFDMSDDIAMQAMYKLSTSTMSRESGISRHEFYKKALDFYRMVVRECESDPTLRLIQARASERVGFILAFTKQPGADEAFDRSIAILDRMYDTGVNQRKALEGILVAINTRQDYILVGPDKVSQNEAESLKAIGLVESHLRREPGDSWWAYGLLGQQQIRLCSLLRNTGRIEEGLARLEVILKHNEALVDELPSHPDRLDDLLGTYRTLCYGLAVARFDVQANRALQKALTIAPDNALFQNNLAWLMSAEIDSAVFNPCKAVEIAREAVKNAPDRRDFVNTLGVALYRNEAYEDAKETFLKAIEMPSTASDGYDWFFLAMTYWRLDDPANARRNFDRGVNWLGNGVMLTEELQRIVKEATELLGEKPPRTPVTGAETSYFGRHFQAHPCSPCIG